MSTPSGLQLSTLVAAREFESRLASDEAIDRLITWCHRVGVKRVFLESFRGYTAPRANVERARDRVRAAGLIAEGCITPVRVGKVSTGWNLIACYTDEPTRNKLKQEFEYAASMFDRIMIDDFLFTDCECAECVAARGDRSWPVYRMELMRRVSRECILDAAKRVNPRCTIIIKYPQWYDRFHIRGYDVAWQSAEFDYTWVGTELRDPDHNDPSVPRVPQYEGFWVMRWLKGIGGDKCLGGWYDDIATSPDTYLEQAWQTILGGAGESLLFNYASLNKPPHTLCIDALVREKPALDRLADLVAARPVTVGVQSPKPPASDPLDGRYVYDHLGMIGLPLIPSTRLDPMAGPAVVTAENLADPQIGQRVRATLDAGHPVVATDGLLRGLESTLEHPKLMRLEVQGDPKTLVRLPASRLQSIRDQLLAPLGVRFRAPAGVALTLLGDDLGAISNFGKTPADIGLDWRGRRGEEVLRIPSQPPEVCDTPGCWSIPARSMVLLRFT